jgi:hypothetical protein
MTKKRQQLIRSLSDVVIQLWRDGILDPAVEDITSRYYGEDRYVPPMMIEEFRQFLPAVRDALDDRGFQTCPLSERYYEEFGGPNNYPATPAEAQRSTTRGSKEMGIMRLGLDPGLDMIWHAHMQWQARCGAGKVADKFHGLGDAIDAGRMSGADGIKIVVGATGLVQPELKRVNTIAAGLPQQPAIESSNGEEADE